ncbi:unnamed protein product [Ectocarpus sp. CCAP 1310/34]|nr:unnamed protein product [Ectocarpus sp. CCAP 1310/34]
MRYSTTPAMLVASWLANRADAFVVAPPSHGAKWRSSRQNQQQQQQQQQLSVTAVRRCSVGSSLARVVPRLKRRMSTAMNTNDGARWAPIPNVPNMEGGTNPEEMMRQMSIPDLAQKLDQAESTFGQVHPQVAAALIPLSQALYANGDLGPARQSCTRALQILQRAYKERPSVEMAEALHTLAMIQQAESPEVGDKALGSQNMALELAMRVFGPDSVEVAAYARCLAQMSEDYSQFLSPGLPRPFYMPNPIPLYRQTLSIIEKVIGPKDPSVASALDDLASALLFHRDDDYTEMKAVTLLPEAETLATRSLAISRASLGEEHPITAGREHNLGMIKRGLQKPKESLDCFRRALAIREKVLGVDHPDTKSSRELVEEEESGTAPPP